MKRHRANIPVSARASSDIARWTELEVTALRDETDALLDVATGDAQLEDRMPPVRSHARLDARGTHRHVADQARRGRFVVRWSAVHRGRRCARRWIRVLRDGRRIAADTLGRFAVSALSFTVHRLVVGAMDSGPRPPRWSWTWTCWSSAPVALQAGGAASRGDVSSRVAASSVESRISGFEERRKFGNGTFIDRDDARPLRQPSDGRRPAVTRSRRSRSAEGPADARGHRPVDRPTAAAELLEKQGARISIAPTSRRAHAPPATWRST